MKIKFLGAAGTVTGSSYVLTSDSGIPMLIDLGMFQGTSEIDKLNYQPYDYECKLLAGAVLTHAHLDHCGRLPILLNMGFEENIWMTAPTRDLTELSLLDSASIAKHDKSEVLYDRELVNKTVDHFRSMEYHAQVPVGDFLVTMKDAGHILGSASLEIVDTKAKSEIKKIVFSGDLGNSPEDLMRETETFLDADVVVMESTYGDRLHPKEDPVAIVQSEINTIEKTGGTLLIPAFSLERTQELMHMLKHLKEEGKILPETVVLMDSPMGQKATIIYGDYPELFNAHVQVEIRNESAFDFSGLTYEDTHTRGPRVIIAGSGMMTGGRIVDHAANYLPLASTRLLIVGYQGEGTLGRKILEGKKSVNVRGQEVQVAATISSTQAMSSHADQRQLLKWLSAIRGVKKVILTHGEDGSRLALGEEVKKMGIKDVVLPTLNQELTI